MTDGFADSEFMLSRFRDICPVENMEDVDVIEARKSVDIAFKIIGYFPENLDNVFRKTWETSEADVLSDFIYEVWRHC